MEKIFRSYIYTVIYILIIIVKSNTVVSSYPFTEPAIIKEKIINTHEYIQKFILYADSA